ncbi:hypothetical protein DV738_g1939, partial [Chaetothyriales sp. CBS 135597]
MIVLHNPSGLQHCTVELLGATLTPALECPERITAILEALSASSHHTIRTINFDLPDPSLPPASEPKDIYARVGYYAFDMSSGINEHTYQAILGVLYVSIHGRDEFPYYTGSGAETGAGPGAGFNVNLPLDTGSSYAEYAQVLDTAIARIRQHAPRFLVVSLGFDTFELDPLGKFGIGTADYETMARAVRRGLMAGEGGS